MLKLANNLSLPPELAGRRTAIFGISGSGKSNTATVITEGLVSAGEQVVLIDPKGEGWGLLSLANGKASNLDIIVFGEPNGHIVPLSENHAKHIADFVVESGRSVVLSLLGFESDQSERRFVATFLRQLYRRKSQQGAPTRTLVVFDEAHLFIPESAGRGFKGEAAELAGACQRIVRQGRSFGLGSLVIDQRPQDVAKRVISQCDTLICHQLVHKTDRDALQDWVRGYDRDGSGVKFLESLASLEPGEAWVWSPAWLKLFQRVHVNRRRTFDSGAAPDGSAAAKAVQRADIDIDALRGQLAEVVEQAEANDPKKLKAEIAKLTRELAAKPKEVSAEPIVKEVPIIPAKEIEALTAEIAGFRKDYNEKLERIAQGFEALNGQGTINQIVNSVEKIISVAKVPVARPTFDKPTPKPMHTLQKPVERAQNLKSHPVSSVAIESGEVNLKEKQQRMLDTLLGFEALGRFAVERAVVGAFVGMTARGGAFRNYVGGLRSGLNGATRPLIEYVGGDSLALTDAGRELATSSLEIGSLEECHQAWLGLIKKEKQRLMVEAVIANYPNPVSRTDLGSYIEMEPSGGAFKNYLGGLRTLGVLDYSEMPGVPADADENDRRGAYATDLLFPEGLV